MMMTEKFKILAKYIKDISSETPDIETFFFVKENISKYHLNIDITSKALKNKLIEVKTTLKFQDKNANEKNNEAIELLVSKKTPYSQPMLIDQIRYLASMLNRVDQEPGDDAYERFKELNEQLESLQNYNLDY